MKMALTQINYFENKNKKTIKVRVCKTILSKATGLMFKKNSEPLLFVFNKNKKIFIHSFFCKSFRAIWLDDKMNATKIMNIKKWKLNISGRGKYLLEIPLAYIDKNRDGDRNI
jgi:uncharacterized membrane protein (UPF0127 family)